MKIKTAKKMAAVRAESWNPEISRTGMRGIRCSVWSWGGSKLPAGRGWRREAIGAGSGECEEKGAILENGVPGEAAGSDCEATGGIGLAGMSSDGRICAGSANTFSIGFCAASGEKICVGCSRGSMNGCTTAELERPAGLEATAGLETAAVLEAAAAAAKALAGSVEEWFVSGLAWAALGIA